MHTTRDRDPRSIIKNRAQGYEREDDQLVGRDHSLTDVFSAGAIVSTVQDLEKWEAGFVGGKLLKRSSIEQIWTPVRLNSGVTYPYGFGWYMETLRGHQVRRHTGQTAGSPHQSPSSLKTVWPSEGAKDISQNAKATMDKLKKLADSVRSP